MRFRPLVIAAASLIVTAALAVAQPAPAQWPATAKVVKAPVSVAPPALPLPDQWNGVPALPPDPPEPAFASAQVLQPPPPPPPPIPPSEQKVIKPGTVLKPGETIVARPVLDSPQVRKEDRAGYWYSETTTNVRFEAVITDQAGTAAPVRKTVAATVIDGGSASVRAGVTVPLVSTTVASKEGTPQPTGVNYRDMGLSLDVRNVVVDGNFVRASLSVEYNPVDEKMADATGTTMAGNMPSFASFKQSMAVALESGKPLQVTQSSDPVPARDRKMTVEVKATILK